MIPFKYQYNEEYSEEENRLLEEFINKSEAAKKQIADQYNPWAEYNNSEKIIYDGKYRNDERGLLASLHEQFHKSIDDGTVYGSLLKIYKLLYEFSDTEKEYYKTVFETLQVNSTKANEIFATWSSTARILYSTDQFTLEDLTSNSKKYIDHYKRGDKLVEGIPGFYNKQCILLSCIEFCFSSYNIGNTAFNDLSNFTFTFINPRDYPNERLIQIIEDFIPSGYLIEKFYEFLSDNICLPEYQPLKTVITGEERVENPSEIPGLLEYFLKLREYFYSNLKNYFDKLDSPSYTFNPTYNIPNEIKEKINAILGFEHYCPLTINTKPEREIIKEFELENVILNKTPEECKIIFPEDLDIDLKMQIFKGDNEPDIWNQDGHIPIMMRHSKFLEYQFNFTDAKDYHWLIMQNKPITFISTRIYKGNKRIVLLIVFRKPSNLNDFFTGNNFHLPLCLCIFTHLLGEEDFINLWLPHTEVICEKYFYYNDLSLLYLFENNFFFQDIQKISYCQIETTFNGDTSCVAIVCNIEFNNKTPLVVISPCNKYYAMLLIKYFKNESNQYYHDEKETFLQSKDNYGEAMLCILKQIYLECYLKPKTYLIKESY